MCKRNTINIHMLVFKNQNNSMNTSLYFKNDIQAVRWKPYTSKLYLEAHKFKILWKK